MPRPPLSIVLLALAGACGGKIAADVLPDGAAPPPDGGSVTTKSGGYCPGESPPPPGTTTCNYLSDCPRTGNDPVDCISRNHPYPSGCGGAITEPRCRDDAGCPPGQICNFAPCNRSICVPGCTPQSCGTAATCTSGHCVRKRCDEPGAQPCDTGWTCHPGPGTQATFGCAADSCQAGYRCPVPLDCNPTGMRPDAHGCAWRPCHSAADCACGSCVDAICESAPGICMTISYPP